MLVLTIGLVFCAVGALGLIPPNNVCYKHVDIHDACVYGNLSVAVIGKTLRPRDCNSHINVKEINNPPYLYINSTNATDRFTVIMVDAGPQGRGPDYLHWMVTNVSINTPNYQHLSPINIIVDYEKPLLMMRSPTLIRFLVFRHDNVLRVPFGELWVTRKRDFSLSLLYSNTSPTLRLCGPVAGIQFWVHDDSGQTVFPPGAPPGPVYVPVVPVQPGYVPVGVAPVPAQSGYAPALAQPGYAPAQPGYAPAPQPGVIPSNPQHTYTNFPKKSAAVISHPLQCLLVPVLMIAVFWII
ncbi:uncharacterized protein LOC124354575 isoform X2 [Homalodisca vitripennis]|nr:uncharacterized protein LOC124354575 isoform X2 [Homalodisca vitripennis]XP_046661093.1 uncharacterized protein LOC124354575 isoform X2 [Homalodisca vitripennis]